MKTNIDVTLTYEQVKALAALGMVDLQEYIDNYNTVEHRIRNNIDRIKWATWYIDDHKEDSFDDSLRDTLELICDDSKELFEHELVESMYFRKHFDQKQRLINVKDRAEFLLKHWDMMKTDDRIKPYPQEMVTKIQEFIEELNK